jgi:hypothetical protein
MRRRAMRWWRRSGESRKTMAGAEGARQENIMSIVHQGSRGR